MIKRLLLFTVLSMAAGIAFSQTGGLKETDKKDTVQHIEIEARVDPVSWKRHLEKTVQKLVDKAARKGMPAGSYTVQIRFLVEKDGSVSDALAINDPGYGIKEALQKTFQSAPKWTPGTIDGRPVRSYHTQPVTFIISGK